MTATLTASTPSLMVGATDYSVGTSIPPATAHAVSVSLPRWQDNVDYEEGRLSNVMETGYPRFFIHKSIQRLASVCLRKFGQASVPWYPATSSSGNGSVAEAVAEGCLLVPSVRVANRCRAFMQRQYAFQYQQTAAGTTASQLNVRIVHFSLVAEPEKPSEVLSIYIVLFPAPAFPFAKSYWQHTGDGISSRRAEMALRLLEQTGKLDIAPAGAEADMQKSASQSSFKQAEEATKGPRSYSRNRHYARAKPAASPSTSSSPSPSPSFSNGLPTRSSASMALNTSSSSSSMSLARSALENSTSSPLNAGSSSFENGKAEEVVDKLCSDHATYVEERYGRNMPRSQAPKAKLALRRRIAGVASGDDAQQYERSAAPRLSEDDVFLYPSGMSSIFHAHQAAMRWRRKELAGSTEGGNEEDETVDVGHAVCFGFPYTDTLKILQKWGPGCWFYGNGVDADLDQLEAKLASSAPHTILALFCEFPSNPLLRTPDLARIRKLADKYNFLIVVDETIGNFVNVEVLHYADIVVSSMTKIFSGETNCMGGSMVLNPQGKHYADLHAVLKEEYEDIYFGDDAVFMERNSRDFVDRVNKIDVSAEALVDMLWQEKDKEGGSKVIKDVFYPKYVTRQHYDACRRPLGGFGGLFSLTFQSDAVAKVFYDALRCAKGPSLGTNFTLASPYCILAHYTELDWAAQFGVESNLVRISVGLESTDALLTMFRDALQRATKSII